MRRPDQGGRRVPWLTGLLGLVIVAVVAVNIAGIWGIAVARRNVDEQSARIFKLESAGRARSFESALSATRADLLFLTASPAFTSLESALAATDPREARWHRLSVEGALLLFLRGHPEVRHMTVRSSQGAALVSAGRRGGVPVLWKSTGPGAITVPAGAGITASIPLQGAGGVASLARAAGRLDADLDAAELLARGKAAHAAAGACELRDAAGQILATEMPRDVSSESSRSALTEALALSAEGWSVPSPWSLRCVRSPDAATTLLDPLASRYRLTLGLNIAVMAIAVLLGLLTIQQAIRRERLEAGAREESRVREVERQLFHTERLSTVGRLAAGMAHEINNPLEGMSNYLSLARDSLSAGDTAAARQNLDRVREGLERAAGVVRRALTHADPATAPRAPLSLDEVLLQSVEFARSRREFAGIRFEVQEPDRQRIVVGDQVTLGQVFLNLIINACEAQPGGGEVRISSSRQAERLIVTIEDRGPGVAPERRSLIFEPFFSTKQSTGLGLSICYAIVRQHGGELTVADRPGGGAIFSIALPTPGAHDHA